MPYPSDHLCPCMSGKTYAECCLPFHRGELPSSALQLMRSRYSAYALCLPAYIMQTTHPANSQYRSNPSLWAEEITQFCRSTQFHRLEIIDSQEDGSSATVTFLARLSQHNQDISFREKSDFEKVDGKWLYRSGQVESTPPS